MNTPIIWMAAGAATGAVYWSHIGPTLCEAVALTVTMLMTLLRCPPHRRKWILMMVGFGLPGINMPHAMDSTTEGHIVGTVVERQKFNAVLKTKRGLVSTRMENPPPVGTPITARVQTDSYRSSFPGAYASTNIKRRLGIPAVRAISWAPINAVEKTVEMVPAQHAGVIHALATGNRTYIDSAVIDTMRHSGTIHLLAISGLHIGMAATMGWILGWVASRPIIGWPQFARLIPTLMAIISAGFYANVVGWPTSTQRAFWMVLIFSVSQLLDRRPDPWHVWGLAFLVVIVFNPAQIESLGLWMSFGAVASLIGWTSHWAQIAKDWPTLLRWLWASIGTSTFATIGILPASAWVFQEVSLSSPIANVLAVPLFAGIAVPASMLATYGPEGGRWLWTALSDTSIDLSLMWMKWIDFGTWRPAVGLGGAALLGVAMMMHKSPKWAIALALLALIRPDARGKNFEISFPDVGQGSASLVQFPDGRTWLVDGGPPGKDLLHWLRRKGIRRINAVFLTHPDMDHLGGLVPVLQELSVDSLWTTRTPKVDEPLFHQVWAEASKRGIRRRVVQNYRLGSDNENSLVIRLRHGKHQILLTGDIGSQTEKRMIPHLESFTIVQAPHHGSQRSSSIEFVEQTSPQLVVIQAGKGNRYGHPHPAISQRWGTQKVLRTDQDGTITFKSDGNKGLVATKKGATMW